MQPAKWTRREEHHELRSPVRHDAAVVDLPRVLVHLGYLGRDGRHPPGRWKIL